MIILFLPIAILGLFYSIHFDSLKQLLSTAVVSAALSYLCSQLGRDRGKKKEAGLWKEWGGTPSVQLLRWSNTKLDEFTKKRYHAKLQQFCRVNQPPTKATETSDPEQADQVYQNWTRYLLSQTRDEKKFSLLLKENTNYGFRRNLWALKVYSIVLILILFIINYALNGFIVKSLNFVNFTRTFFFSSGFLAFALILWLFIFTKNWIKTAAFAYAEKLLECVERLENP